MNAQKSCGSKRNSERRHARRCQLIQYFSDKEKLVHRNLFMKKKHWCLARFLADTGNQSLADCIGQLLEWYEKFVYDEVAKNEGWVLPPKEHQNHGR
jgi:hypothetical protein